MAVRRVVFATNDRGFDYLRVAAYTLLGQIGAGEDYEICVLEGEGGVSAEHKRALERLAAGRARVTFIDVDAQLERYRAKFLSVKQGRTLMIWSRLFIGELMPEVDANVLYLDTDVYVRQRVSDLFDTELGNCLIGMVAESSRASNPEKFNRPGMPAEMSTYFNAGVALLNPARWHAERLLDRMLEWIDAAAGATFVWADQDALNAVLCGRIMRLHPKWNYHDGWVERSCRLSVSAADWRGNGPREVLEAIASPHILHYWGRKPWRYCHRPEHRCYEEAMRELGLLEGALPGTTLAGRLALPLWDGAHAVMKRLAAWRLRRLAPMPSGGVGRDGKDASR